MVEGRDGFSEFQYRMIARGIFLPLTLPDLNTREEYHIRKVSKPVSEDCHCGNLTWQPMERNERKISSYSFRDYKSLPFHVEQASMSNREASLPPEKH